ncbi:hypothetical protein Gohar_026619 [Gossypium harknessii]|uniref:Uncharacterized protein n=1 Tax=Gossypium harknessii TaxID=34285 RepID=A0A7J9HTJ3_9ROSI|nr:hypothetical protein [Gossypium harknessii]
MTGNLIAGLLSLFGLMRNITNSVSLYSCISQAAIVNSQTLEEVARLEKALQTGQLPADLKIPGDDTNAAKGGDEKKVSDIQNESNVEPDNMDEDKNEEPAPMEQVWNRLNSSQSVECIVEWQQRIWGIDFRSLKDSTQLYFVWILRYGL